MKRSSSSLSTSNNNSSGDEHPSLMRVKKQKQMKGEQQRNPTFLLSEIWINNISNFLTVFDLAPLASVCKYFQVICNNPQIWERKFSSDWETTLYKCESAKQSTNWKTCYMGRYTNLSYWLDQCEGDISAVVLIKNIADEGHIYSFDKFFNPSEMKLHDLRKVYKWEQILEDALKLGHIYMARRIIESGVKPKLTSIFDVAAGGDLIGLKTLKETCKLDFSTLVIENGPGFIDRTNDCNILHHILQRASYNLRMGYYVPDEPDQILNVIKFILHSGGESLVDKKNYFGQTPLCISYGLNNPKIAQLLIDMGAKVDSVDSFGHTPLSNAAMYGRYETARVLIENGANVDGEIGVDRTPLREAVYGAKLHSYSKCDTLKIIRLLVSKGANINRSSPLTHTPFYSACQTTDIEIVKLLVDLGADITIIPDGGHPHLCMEENYKNMLKQLETYGKDCILIADEE